MNREQYLHLLDLVETLEGKTKKKYIQGRKSLKVRRPDKKIGFCCLGVACDVYRLQTKDGKWGAIKNTEKHMTYKPKNKQLHRARFTVGSGEMAMGFPPSVVNQWFGISENDTRNLANLNDDKRWGFRKIAKYIRETILTRYQLEPEGGF